MSDRRHGSSLGWGLRVALGARFAAAHVNKPMRHCEVRYAAHVQDQDFLVNIYHPAGEASLEKRMPDGRLHKQLVPHYVVERATGPLVCIINLKLIFPADD